MPRTFPLSSLLIGSMTLAAGVAADEAAMEKLRARLKSAEQFGTECCQLLPIPASAFQPLDAASDSMSYEGKGYVDVDGLAWAPVVLPTGAVLDYIDYYFFIDDPQVSGYAALYRHSGPTLLGAPPSEQLVGQVYQSGTDGYGYVIEEISGTIDNSVWFSGGAQYAVFVHNTVFKGVTIWWHREVSPPPGSATFNDVPTGHPQFQFIEALAESGITVGCGGGNFCPNSPLTRGQMAVFLAKALGLHWPF